jgi:hypothetical protein
MAKHIIAKGGTAVTEHEYTATLMEYCKLHKRDGESDVTAFSRIFEAPESLDFRRAYAIIKGFPNMMDTTPVSTEVGSTETSDDSAAALRQLNELAEKQRALAPTLTIQQAFARVFENPDNRALAARAHRRPTASSTSGSELQQR